MIEQAFTLVNGVKVPKLAFGTYQLPEGDAGYQLIRDVVVAGYRHFDSTYGYNNEALMTKVIHDTGLKREDFFLASKLWNADQGYDSTLAAFEKVCTSLHTDYLDLFLIRWPIPIGHKQDYQALNHATWQAFEKLYEEKRVRAIGVCNFLVHHLEPLMHVAHVKPMVNQLEFNPMYQQREVVSYCQANEILVESWAPIGHMSALQNATLTRMSAQHQTTVQSICLAYCLAKNVLPITYAEGQAQIERNTKIFDVRLSAKDMQFLDSLNTLTEYTFHPDRHEEWFE